MPNLLFCDSFSHYNAAYYGDKYNYVVYADRINMGSPGALGFGQYMINGGTIISRQLSSAQTGLTVGFRFNIDSESEVVPGTYFVVQDASYNVIGYLQINESGSVAWYTGTGTLVVASAVGQVTFSQWYFLEFEVTLATGATGSVTINLNGTTIATASSVATQSGAACQAIGMASPATTFFQDLYVLSGTPGFLGDVTVAYQPPNKNGSTNNFTPFPNTNANWQNVDDTTAPDGDSSYNYDDTANDKDMYGFAALATTGTIFGFQLVALARKDNSGSRSVKLGVGDGATSIINTNVHSLNESYDYVLEPYDDNPITSAQLTPSDFNSLQIIAETV